jgi:hypothetical protein
MLELDLLPIRETEHDRDVLQETVKHLCERSLQLQEYSRSLRNRSKEINQRVRSLLNTKGRNSGTVA